MSEDRMNTSEQEMPDIESMSDEEFQNAFEGTIESVGSSEEETVEDPTEEPTTEETNTGKEEVPDTESEENSVEGAAEADKEEAGSDDPAPAGEEGNPDDDAEASADTETTGEEEENPNAENDDAPDEDPRLAAYEQIMAPFKANGRQVKLSSPEEVVRLMQQGANYTRKMQALKPNLRMMRMLENQGLLNEDKLNFLIDLDKRNPQAIRKLLADAKIDPMDLDTSADAPAYKPGNHAVSDKEMAFHSSLDDVMSTQEGKETVALIERSWDDASKAAIYEDPAILRIIDSHRDSGIYQKISDEMEKRKMLGTLDADKPFINAYKEVGDALEAQGLLAPEQKTGNPTEKSDPATPAKEPQERRVIEQRIGTNPSKAQANAAARATSPARSRKPARKEFDPLALSDEEFLQLDATQV